MKRHDPEQLLTRIHERLSSLAFQYVDSDGVQTLSVADGAVVRFPESAGGSVAGGSAAWVRAKHRNGAVHEPGLIAALMALAEIEPACRTVFDIGALYGYFSLLARSMFRGAEVHAFEVNPSSFKALQRNIAANAGAFGDSIMAHHCALSDLSTPHAKLRVSAFTVEVVADGHAADSGKPVHDIDVWSLDDFCRANALAPQIIKLDVEGYQAKIIPGAMGIISSVRPVVLLEFDAANADNSFGVTNKDVIKPLMDCGYRLIWGRHRNREARFEVLEWDELAERHEVNSLGILVP